MAARGAKVTLFEAAGQAGGRCRSYFDPAFGGVIDNGNHLVLSGNKAVKRYLTRIGAKGVLSGPAEARVDFADIASGEHWSVRPNKGPLPWWVAAKSRRVPGTHVAEYAPYARLLFASKKQTMGDLVPCRGPLWDRLMHPFFLAALNTEPRLSSARLAGALLRETFAKGGQACRPRIATPTLAAAFVDPALNFLRSAGRRSAPGRTAARHHLRAARGRWRWNFPTPPFHWGRTMRWCWRCRPGSPAIWCRT